MAYRPPEVRNEHILAYREGRLDEIPPRLLEKVKEQESHNDLPKPAVGPGPKPDSAPAPKALPEFKPKPVKEE